MHRVCMATRLAAPNKSHSLGGNQQQRSKTVTKITKVSILDHLALYAVLQNNEFIKNIQYLFLAKSHL